jgi:orotate phosphoribosyltransferase-like protein
VICNQRTRVVRCPTSDTANDEIVVDLRELSPWEKNVDRVKELWDKGLHNEEIAEELNCNRNQVTKAIAFWHLQRGLKPPNGRSRWRQLDRESKSMEPTPLALSTSD